MSIVKKIQDEKANTASAQRTVAFNYLFDNAVDKVQDGKFYLFEYNPKYKLQLKHWDKYPMVLVLELYEDGFIGANLHYTTPKARMLFVQKFLNKSARVPVKLIHRYIVDRADNIFFEIPKKELVQFAALPIEQFYDSKNRFVSAKKIQASK